MAVGPDNGLVSGESAMARFMLGFFVLLIVIGMTSGVAQTDERDPGFTLSLSSRQPPPEIPRNILMLVVRRTNTSDGLMREDGCTMAQGLYRLVVVYNGTPIEEPEEVRKRREALEAGDCRMASTTARQAKPGKYWEDPIYYDTAKPGTYEFTVEEKAFPGHPENSQTVKSNTLTVVVREPQAEAPK
jgi:hypothetical protein